MSESCSNRNSSIIETFKLPQRKKSSLYNCASWNFKHQGLHCNLPNTMFLSVMTPKNYQNYLVNLSSVNFTDSGHQNSIKLLQVNSLCRKILHQIDVSVSRNCTQLRSSCGARGTASPLQPCSSVTQTVRELEDLRDGSALLLRQNCAETSSAIRQELLTMLRSVPTE